MHQVTLISVSLHVPSILDSALVTTAPILVSLSVPLILITMRRIMSVSSAAPVEPLLIQLLASEYVPPCVLLASSAILSQVVVSPLVLKAIGVRISPTNVNQFAVLALRIIQLVFA